MESLHMTYTEVMHTPYMNLLALQADKLRVEYSEKKEVEKVSGKEMLNRKKNK